MKNLHTIAIALILSLSASQIACKSSAGEVGPAGTTGAKGDTGAKRDTGPAGTANVTQINYAGRSVTGNFSLNLTGVNADKLNNSLVFCYMLATNNSWYQLPGFTSGGTFEYRIYLTGATVSTLTISRVTGGAGADTFVSMRALVIPAGTVVNGRKAAVDYSNYEEVKRYYNLAD